MGYEDREYFQSKPKFELSAGVHPATKGLLIAAAVGYLLALILGNSSSFADIDFFAKPDGTGAAWVRKLVVLTPGDICSWLPGFKVGHWKLLTHWLVPSGLIGAVIDCILLFFAGRMVEELFGTRRFLLLFVITCVTAGLLAALTDSLMMRDRVSVIMGPGAGTIAAFTSVAWIAPNQRSIMGWRMRPLVLTLVGITCAVNLAIGVASGADIATSPTQLAWGALVAAAYMAFLKTRGRIPAPAPGSYEEAWSKRGNLPEDVDPVARSLAQARKDEERERQEDDKRRAEQDSEQRKLDAILAKISAQGIASLSRGEKSFLEQQSQKRKS